MENERSNECNLISLNNITPLDIDKVDNKSNIQPPNSIECPICFENINSTDALLILDCCQKKVHLQCIVSWYTKYPDNKFCFMCNQTNNFCKDLVCNSDRSETISENTNTDNSIIVQIDTDQEIARKDCKRIISIFIGPVVIISCFICWGLVVFVDYLIHNH